MAQDIGDAMKLPSFAKPPVVEVAVAAYFLPLPGLDVIELVGLHRLWETRFPKIQQQPALPPATGPVSKPIISFQLSTGLAPVRIWMLSEDEAYLVQTQNDRLILNWRKTNANRDAYPRYSYLRQLYDELWSEFARYITSRELGAVQPNFVEVSYYNRVDLISGEHLEDYIRPLDSSWTTERKSVVYRSETDLRDDFGGVIGTQSLTMSQDIAGGHFGRIEIASRIALQDGSPTAMFNCLDQAHSFGVRAFDESSSPYAHEKWGRK
jgi:uncharacterized protein (TIGR04255 family)